MSTSKFRPSRVAGAVAMLMLMYCLLLPGLGALLTWAHSWLGLAAHTFWFGFISVTIAAVTFFPTDQLIDTQDSESSEWIMGVYMAAMLALPLHFSFLCRSIEVAFPGSFSSSNQGPTSFGEWLQFSLHNTVDTVFWSVPSLYDLVSTVVSPKTQVAKATVLVFRLSLTFLFVASAFRAYKFWKHLRTGTQLDEA